MHGRRRPGVRERARHRARLSPDRDPRFRQPLPGDPGAPPGRRLRRRARQGVRARSTGAGRDHVPLRESGLRPPGGHRLPTGVPPGHANQVPAPRDRPRAGLCALRFAGGPRLLCGHVLRREHVVRQPPGDSPPHPGGPLRGFSPGPGASRHPRGLRRGAQHGEDRAPRDGARPADAPRAPQGRHAGVPSGPSGPAARVPRDRPARDHRRQHGDGGVRAGRPAERRGGPPPGAGSRRRRASPTRAWTRWPPPRRRRASRGAWPTSCRWGT